MCSAGRASSQRAGPSSRSSVARAEASSAAADSATSFGVPVEPEVAMTTAVPGGGSSGGVGTGVGPVGRTAGPPASAARRASTRRLVASGGAVHRQVQQGRPSGGHDDGGAGAPPAVKRSQPPPAAADRRPAAPRSSAAGGGRRRGRRRRRSGGARARRGARGGRKYRQVGHMRWGGTSPATCRVRMSLTRDRSSTTCSAGSSTSTACARKSGHSAVRPVVSSPNGVRVRVTDRGGS
jgi:hypothetical protein